ncbi:MAG: hypothetical protein ACYC27_14735 [Armatimonadota bacterium]
MPKSFAATTYVSIDRTRNEIERLLVDHGADQFGYMQSGDQAAIMFRMNSKMIRFVISMPKMEDFSRTPTGLRRTQTQIRTFYEQGCRQRWRALLLIIRAKFEAIKSGITEFEEEFLSYIMLPNGQTTGNWMKPQIQAAYESGRMPLALPGSGFTGE